MKTLLDVLWMVWGFVVTVFLGFLTLFCAFFIMVSGFFGCSKEFAFKALQTWSVALNFLTRTEIRLHGVENIPKEGCLFIFNHLSLFDIPILIANIPKTTKFGAKEELLKIPFFGGAMRAAGALIINRGNRPEAIKTLNAAKSRMDQGENFALAAEGTRQKEPRIGKFKSGPFILGIQAQVPIVPIVLVGPDKIAPKGRLWVNLRTTNVIEMVFLPPVSTEGKTLEDRKIMKEEVRAEVVKAYEQFS